MKSLKHLIPLFLFLLPFGLLAQSNPVGNWKAELPDGQGGTMKFKVSMKADNSYEVDLGMDGTIDIKGTYQLDGDKMTIQDVPGSDCTGKGVYTFSISNNQITMVRQSDECEGRGGPEGKMIMTKM